MRRALLFLAVALAALPSAAAEAGSGPTAALSLAGGGELGLDSGKGGADAGKAGVVEIAGTAGWELGGTGFRPELGLALGFAPDTHVALRPGLSWSVPQYPFRLRVAVDVSNARQSSLGWRWLLVGGSAEVRLTGGLAFDAGLDFGVPLDGRAGVPILIRVGSSLRL